MSTANRMLRFTLGMELVLIAFYVVVPYVHPLKLSGPLQAYLDHGAQYGWAPGSPVNTFVTIPLTCIHLICAVVLLFFRRWARLPYLVCGVWSFLGVLFGGPPVQHVLEYALEESWIFLSGISCGLMYYAAIEWYRPSKA